jgi:hypothetical protein
VCVCVCVCVCAIVLYASRAECCCAARVVHLTSYAVCLMLCVIAQCAFLPDIVNARGQLNQGKNRTCNGTNSAGCAW